MSLLIYDRDQSMLFQLSIRLNLITIELNQHIILNHMNCNEYILVHDWCTSTSTDVRIISYEFESESQNMNRNNFHYAYNSEYKNYFGFIFDDDHIAMQFKLTFSELVADSILATTYESNV